MIIPVYPFPPLPYRFSEATGVDIIMLVHGTSGHFDLGPQLGTLIIDLVSKDNLPIKMVALGWIKMKMKNSNEGEG